MAITKSAQTYMEKEAMPGLKPLAGMAYRYGSQAFNKAKQWGGKAKNWANTKHTNMLGNSQYGKSYADMLNSAKNFGAAGKGMLKQSPVAPHLRRAKTMAKTYGGKLRTNAVKMKDNFKNYADMG
jgi:hypothetical protein